MTESEKSLMKLELFYKTYSELNKNSPIMSGNMKSFIIFTGNDVRIYAPFYDIKKWKKSGEIVHTGESIYGFTDYAQWVNQVGGFGTHNKSEHWVNRVCNDVADMVARKYKGKVIKRLPR